MRHRSSWQRSQGAAALAASAGRHPRARVLERARASREPLSVDDTARVVKRCAKDGVIVGRTIHTEPGLSNVLILAPPFTLSDDEAALLVDTLETAIAEELGTDRSG